jgi:hypothetical protein
MRCYTFPLCEIKEIKTIHSSLVESLYDLTPPRSQPYKRSILPWPLNTATICVPSFPPRSNRCINEVVTIIANPFVVDSRLCLHRPFLATVGTTLLASPYSATADKRWWAITVGRSSSCEPIVVLDSWSMVDWSSRWSMSHGPSPPPSHKKTIHKF